MTTLWMALLSGAMVASAGAPLQHHTRVDHASGAAEALYRGEIAVEQREVGTVGPGGRASTLRCRWTAGLVVDREARHASGATFARRFDTGRVIEGSRPGWCTTHRRAIAQEIAQRSGELHGHLVAVAQEDHHVLRAELDRSRG